MNRRDVTRHRAAIFVERDPPALVIDDGRPVRLPLDAETVAFLLAELAKLARASTPGG